MKKGEIHQGIVERVEFPNKGYVTCEGEKVVVKNAIPGQTIEFMINKIRKGKYEARLLSVVKPSICESEEPCRLFGQCGGCTYQTMAYDTQLDMKEKQVKKLIDEVVKDEYEFEGILASPNYKEYRNKMEFSFGDASKGGPLELGLHKRNSMFDVLTVDGCQLVDSDFSAILSCVKAYCDELKLDYYHKMSHEGYLRHLLVRKAAKTGEILVDLITTTKESPDLNRLADLLVKLELKGKIAGILHTKNDSLSDAVINEGTEILYGVDYIYEELLGLRFKISPFSFFQTNSLGAEVLYSKAREYVGNSIDLSKRSDNVVFDLYSGTGTIAQILSPVAKKVVGVEIVPEAVEAAKVNASLNGLDNCDFIAGDVLKALDDIEEKPDFIVLDPPRDGINPKALDKIIAYGVNSMVYISCKPTSLARDLVTLQEQGYKLIKAACVDMFPNTANVETVCLLSRKAPV